MGKKKGFIEYYSLVYEGTAEESLFAYLTKVRFKKLFDKSNIKFSNKIEIPKSGISKGKLNGISDLASFKKKYQPIKRKDKRQKLFFLIDKDLDDSSKIEEIIKRGDDIIQFVEYNSEYLLLNFAGNNTKNPSYFPNNLKNFRNYCKIEFRNKFGKEASEFKDQDFNNILKDVGDDEIKKAFPELFSTLTK